MSLLLGVMCHSNSDIENTLNILSKSRLMIRLSAYRLNLFFLIDKPQHRSHFLNLVTNVDIIATVSNSVAPCMNLITHDMIKGPFTNDVS